MDEVFHAYAGRALGLGLLGVIAGCAVGPPGAIEEPTGASKTAFTSLSDAMSWCQRDNGGSPPSQTFSGTSHAATLYAEIESIESAVLSSTYTSSTVAQIDEATGMYNVDCSSLVDYAMCDCMVDLLAQIGGAHWPAAVDYYDWIVNGGSGVTRITDVRAIEAGDLIAVKYPTTGCSSTIGHVMVAGQLGVGVGTSVSSFDPARSRYDVPVLDATSTPTHTGDFRQHGGAVGGGTVAFSYDASFAPTAFYWSVGSSTPSPISCGWDWVAVGRLQ